MTTALELVAVALVVAANGFFVAAEYALVTVRRTRLQELEAQGSRAAVRVLRLVDKGDESLARSGGTTRAKRRGTKGSVA